MLHPLAQDGVFSLTADFDRQTLLDWFVRFHGEIRELDAVAARERRRPAAQDDVDRLDLPLVVGQAILRRPSVAGREWLRTCASAWWGESRRAYGFALAFACAHRAEEAYAGLRSRLRARLAVWRWVMGVRASEEALRRAALSLMPPPDDSIRWFEAPDDPQDESSPDLLAIALTLSKQFGGSPSHWLWEVADDDFWKAVCDLQDDADAKADDVAMAKGNGHADDSWWLRHRRAIRRCEEHLETETLRWIAERQPAAHV